MESASSETGLRHLLMRLPRCQPIPDAERYGTWARRRQEGEQSESAPVAVSLRRRFAQLLREGDNEYLDVVVALL